MIWSKWPEFPPVLWLKGNCFAFSVRKHETQVFSAAGAHIYWGREGWGEPTKHTWDDANEWEKLWLRTQHKLESMWRTFLQLTRTEIMINDSLYLVSESFCCFDGMCYEPASMMSMSSIRLLVDDWYLLLSLQRDDESWFSWRHMVSTSIGCQESASPSFAPFGWSRLLAARCWKNERNQN